jgi:hypothetical protein
MTHKIPQIKGKKEVRGEEDRSQPLFLKKVINFI